MLVKANTDWSRKATVTNGTDILSNGFKVRSTVRTELKQVVHTSTWHLQKIHS